MREPSSQTPILDLEAPIPARRSSSALNTWQSLVVITSILIAPIGIALLIISMGLDQSVIRFLAAVDRMSWRPVVDSLSPIEIPVFLASFVVIQFLPLAIHEFGHLAAAKLVGFDFQSLAAGPFFLSRTAGKVR